MDDSLPVYDFDNTRGAACLSKSRTSMSEISSVVSRAH